MSKLNPNRGDKKVPLGAYYILLVLFLIRMASQQQKVSLGYFYGFQAPEGAINPASFYSISAEYPKLKEYYGLLAGPAFSISNALAGIYFGKKADSSNRIKLLSFAIIGWSITSIMNGSVNSLAALAIGRFVLGMFTAAGEPLIFSLIGDTIPIEKVPVANSIIKAANYLGSALCGLSALLIPTLGWRVCALGIGFMGVVIGSLALLTIKEPSRGAIDPERF